MDAYYTTPVGPFHVAAGAAFGTFTTRQDISPIPCPVILPGMLRVGTQIKIEAEGEYSTTGTPTLALGFYAGLVGNTGIPAGLTTIIADSVANTTGAGTAAQWPWRLMWRGLITALGVTSGSVLGAGSCEFGTTISALTLTAVPITAALRTVTRDTTIAWCIGVCGTYSASSASNTVKVNSLLVSLQD
jgi:hypothetical protein